jgi:hypothetical protein
VRSPPRAPVGRTGVLALVLALVVLAATVPSRASAAYPVAPLAFDRAFLSNLTAPSLGPGGSTSVGFRLADPASFGALTSVVLLLEIYALNGYPGDAVGPVPVANAPTLENATASGPSVNVSVPALAPGASVSGSVRVVTSASTPAGTYAVRTALSFVENSTAYRFESRGWFTAAAWANATEEANGTATLNASRLGVSGVVPETAVYVAPSGWPVAVGALLAAGLVLVGLGAWLYFRKGPGSSSGAAKPDAPGATNAPSAFGSSRSSPGDSRSS